MPFLSKTLEYKYFGYLLLLLISITFLVLEVINDHFWLSDFEVYYRSAERFLNGKNLYRIESDGHYIFKYSPISALYFVPFTVFPFTIAKYIFWIFITGVSCLGYKVLFELVSEWSCRKGARIVNSVMVILVLVSAIHFLRELHLGQVNFILLSIYVVLIGWIHRSKNIYSGMLLAVTVFIKPFSLIYIPYLVIKKHYMTLLSFLVSMMILAVIPVLFYGSLEKVVGEYSGWFNEITVELSNKKDLMMDGNLTLFSILARYTPFYFLAQIVSGGVYRLIVLGLLGMLFVFIFFKNRRSNVHVISDLILLTGVMPLIAYTSANAFCFVIPVICAILFYWSKLGRIQRMISMIGLFLYGGNFAELIGRDNSQIFDDLSLLSVGTVLLISVYISIMNIHSDSDFRKSSAL